jgi:hypothetical protein
MRCILHQAFIGFQSLLVWGVCPTHMVPVEMSTSTRIAGCMGTLVGRFVVHLQLSTRPGRSTARRPDNEPTPQVKIDIIACHSEIINKSLSESIEQMDMDRYVD